MARFDARAAQAHFALGALPSLQATGRLGAVIGPVARLDGMAGLVRVGDRVAIDASPPFPGALAEIVAVEDGRATMLLFGPERGLRVGLAARSAGPALLRPAKSWLGRVVDPLGRPLDGGALPQGAPRPLRRPPVPPVGRARLGPALPLGVRALDLFTPCRAGQRLGLFAGPGVGKSTLLGMIARNTACDHVVVALVGERGREVRAFIEDDLGPALARAVVVVATSDDPPLLRREAAYAAMTIAEHLRDSRPGARVLLLLDSLTRVCAASRDIALAAGEPTGSRGYPPSVFAELPGLLERAGPGRQPATGEPGHVSAMLTVLVDGDDMTEPVADAARGLLDGHVVLDRRIAESGRYPAVDVPASLSRAAPACLAPEDAETYRRARALLALRAEMADMIRLGAYAAGTDPEVDEAVAKAPLIEALLRQAPDEPAGSAPFDRLRAALAGLPA